MASLSELPFELVKMILVWSCTAYGVTGMMPRVYLRLVCRLFDKGMKSVREPWLALLQFRGPRHIGQSAHKAIHCREREELKRCRLATHFYQEPKYTGDGVVDIYRYALDVMMRKQLNKSKGQLTTVRRLLRRSPWRIDSGANLTRCTELEYKIRQLQYHLESHDEPTSKRLKI